MKRWLVAVALILSSLFASPVWADEVVPGAQCEPSVVLTMEQRDALVSLNSRLSGLWRHYGKDSFEPSLRKLLRGYDPVAKVIEISPLLMEKMLYVTDRHRLFHSIARTVGLDNPLWVEFERNLRSVVLFDGIYYKKYGVFDRKVEKLLLAIKKSPQSQNPIAKLGKNKQREFVDEAIARVADMYISMARMDAINRQAIDERAEAAARQAAIMAIGLVSGTVLVVTTVYAAPVVAGAGVVGGSLSSNAAMAAILARLGQVAAGSALGVVGAPSGRLLADSASMIATANAESKNNGTKYSCELDRQIHIWQSKGLQPYMESALLGGTIGAGGVITLAGNVSSRILLLATTFGVSVAQLYSVGKLGKNALEALAEYRLALEAMERGDRETALKHLHQSRIFAGKAGERAVESIILGVLSHHIANEFRTALVEGGAAIRAIYASSADTLPMSMQVANEAIEAVSGAK